MRIRQFFKSLASIACLMGLAGVGQAQTLAIRGGTIHTLAGPDIANGTVVMQNGKITAVGTNVQVPAGATVIDASGKHVYPGMFDAITRLGLTEIGAVDVTNDYQELGTFDPQLYGMTAVHPASELIPVARANGITHAAAAPNARTGGIGGQASLVNLDGWTIEDMLVQKSIGMMTNWPSLGGGFGRFFARFGGGGGTSFRERERQYHERIDSLTAWLDAARQYQHAVHGGADVPRDLKLEALEPVIDGKLPMLMTADEEREIKDAVMWADSQNVKIVLLGPGKAYLVADFLVEHHVPVILGATQALPTGENEPYDEEYSQPAKLYAAGVTFAISTFNASDSRTLPYEAGFAVPYGLPEAEAIKAITLYPAQILGVADRLGSIEVGKIGNLIVTDGSPLEYQTTFEHVIINGRDASLMNKHLELYEKYKARPKK